MTCFGAPVFETNLVSLIGVREDPLDPPPPLAAHSVVSIQGWWVGRDNTNPLAMLLPGSLHVVVMQLDWQFVFPILHANIFLRFACGRSIRKFFPEQAV